MARQSKEARKQAIADHKAARAELERISKRDGAETDEWLAANSRAIQTEANVPFYRR
jgi:hypothetical protein